MSVSELEDVVSTVVRLLASNVRVVKEDGSIAQVHVDGEWCDRELLKGCDGQITVGLAESRDSKVEMSGRTHRRTCALRVNVWATDRSSSSDSGRLMRSKMVEEVNRVVRQNRNRPNVVEYTFAGLGYPSGEPHKAFQTNSSTEPVPSYTGWSELTSSDYEKIWYSDDQRCVKSAGVDGEYAFMLYRFRIDSREETVKKIVLSFEGYGTAPIGNGVVIKVWNHMASAWQQPQSGAGEGDETITITLTSNLPDYVDGDGFVWLLARTMNPSNGATEAILHCDYAACAVTVNGITYLDVVSYRHVDRVDVKPFIFRTEFTLKSWSFEDIGGVF
jgi:hypothetical protein